MLTVDGKDGNRGNSFSNGPDAQKLWRSRAIADARAMTVTFWDLI